MGWDHSHYVVGVSTTPTYVGMDTCVRVCARTHVSMYVCVHSRRSLRHVDTPVRYTCHSFTLYIPVSSRSCFVKGSITCTCVYLLYYIYVCVWQLNTSHCAWFWALPYPYAWFCDFSRFRAHPIVINRGGMFQTLFFVKMLVLCIFCVKSNDKPYIPRESPKFKPLRLKI